MEISQELPLRSSEAQKHGIFVRKKKRKKKSSVSNRSVHIFILYSGTLRRVKGIKGQGIEEDGFPKRNLFRSDGAIPATCRRKNKQIWRNVSSCGTVAAKAEWI